MGWEEWDHNNDYNVDKFPIYTFWDYDETLSVYEDDGTGDVSFYWNPLKSWDDCMQLVDKLREKGYVFNMQIDEEGIGFVVFTNEDDGIEVVFSPETDIKDPQTAILTAATKL